MARDLFLLVALLAACWMKALDKQHNSFFGLEKAERLRLAMAAVIIQCICRLYNVDVECEEFITFNTVHIG